MNTGQSSAATTASNDASSFSGLLDRWGAWIESLVNPATGAIRDPYSRNPLHFQYHYAAFILGRASAPASGSDPLRDRVFEYLCRLPDSERRITDEFNAYLLSLAHFALRDSDPEFASRITGYLVRLPKPDAAALLRRNRNFAFMYRFAVHYQARARGESTPQPLGEHTDRLIRESLTDSGWLIDSPTAPKQGCASFVYHIKIAASLLCDGILNNTPGDFEIGRRAIDRVFDFVDVADACCFGRSQSSLFGYANLYLALTLLAVQTRDPRYESLRRQTANLIEGMELSGGELALTLAHNNSERHGFDLYMHAVVYNAYAWAMARFAEHFAARSSDQPISPGTAAVEKNQPIEIPTSTPLSERSGMAIAHDTDVGFLSCRSSHYRLFLTVKGHHDNPKYWTDPRYLAFVPQVLRADDNLIVPPIPVDNRGLMRLAVRRSMRDRISSAFAAAGYILRRIQHANFLDVAGFLPIVTLKNGTKLGPGTQLELDDVKIGPHGGVSVHSRFALDAAMPSWFLGARSLRKAAAPWRSGKSTMDISLQLAADFIRYDVRLDCDAPLMGAMLTHFGMRLPPLASVEPIPSGLALTNLGRDITVHHDLPLGNLKRRDVRGSTGSVQLLSCSRTLDQSALTLTTEIRFGAPAASDSQ